MKKTVLLFAASFSLLLSACSNNQAEADNIKISASEFQKKITETPSAKIIDVRTPGEFMNGHIKNAINIDWRNGDFESKITQLNKKEPIFIYCLSGGRSSAAGEAMKSMGFTNVFELAGGLLKWNAAGMPITTDNSSQPVHTGMSVDDFQKLLKTDKLVLIDFYAEWCAPCKKMEPFLAELNKEMSNKLVVIRIDVDENKTLAEQLRISDIPALRIYKNEIQVWDTTGLISKEDLTKEIQRH